MPYRTTFLANGEYYHIFNRGVAKMNVFTNSFDYRRFLKTIQYYQVEGPKPRFSIFSSSTQSLNTNKKVISLITYCLMPNHFHLLVRQEKDGGISEFVSKLVNSYTKYFNTKYNRVGPLFQGQFKAVHIENNEQLLHVHRYIHLNPVVSYLQKHLEDYKWSSYSEYVSQTTGMCMKEVILAQFSSTEEYTEFIQNQIDYGRSLEIIKHQLLDFEE